MKTLRQFFINLGCREDGAAAVEYAILLSCIAIAIVATVSIFGGSVQKLYQDAVDKLQ